ncbi:MAG: zinc ribbon domain-containing protein, partial [Candidatus Brockarchaeota archaeon]|nr:zinc ribbon domain-containing protein [Candidatus Brockarchaeota archaeon]
MSSRNPRDGDSLEVDLCPSCRAPLLPDHKYCSNCGAPRPSAHLPHRVPTGIPGTPVGLDDLL